MRLDVQFDEVYARPIDTVWRAVTPSHTTGRAGPHPGGSSG
jgi:hypothetical protein